MRPSMRRFKARDQEASTVRAADMEPDCVYKHTRDSGGIYYVRAPEGTAERMVQKLARSVQAQKASTQDKAVYQAALGELKGEVVLARRFVRGVADGEKYEVSELVGIPADYKLRRVGSKPGYLGAAGL